MNIDDKKTPESEKELSHLEHSDWDSEAGSAISLELVDRFEQVQGD